MATGERPQMSAINLLAVSPLWYGELASYDEGSDLSCHQRPEHRKPRLRGIAAPGQPMLPQSHVRAWKSRLELANHGPLSRGGGRRH